MHYSYIHIATVGVKGLKMVTLTVTGALPCPALLYLGTVSQLICRHCLRGPSQSIVYWWHV